MSYVDAFRDVEKDEICVVERVNGERVYKTYASKYIFYYDDTKGKYRSIFGDNVSKYQTTSFRNFKKELALCSGKKIFESDLNPVFRCLAENYMGKDAPKLHIALFDIEVGFDPARGYSTPTDPFSPVTAISVWLNWLDKVVTLVLPPDEVPWEEAEKTIANFPNTFLFRTEKDLLEAFLEIIEDVDVMSGWNSTGFDIPYLVTRMEIILSKEHTRQLCLWNLLPRKRQYTKYGREQTTYDIFGRVHLDYLELYMKHALQQLHSYRLDYVAQTELGERKIPYEGSLDDLYRKDFSKFIEYNRQDVHLLVGLDKKLRYIELANQLAHTNTVLIQNTMGAVVLIEQAIINEAHSLGYVMPDRKRRETADSDTDDDKDEEEEAVVGAYVADPKIGLHDWVGGCDINSLYPSAIRTFNMSPETLFGQIRQELTDKFISERQSVVEKSSDVWTNIFACLEYDEVMKKSLTPLILDTADGKEIRLTAGELYNMVFESDKNLCISANGTIFRTDHEGIIPHLLSRWYRERQEMQSKMRGFDTKEKDETDPELKKSYEAEKEFWDRRQYVRKILLNSLYGAILNPYCRVFDERIGKSVTLTGRMIVRHQTAVINHLITGEYNHVGEAIIYGDTDSSYFSAYPVMKNNPDFANFEWTKEKVVELYDAIAEEMNKTFPKFLHKAFNTPQHKCVIKSERELVGIKGLFITKKRYAILMYIKGDMRLDVNGKPGKIKAMGLDLKRSDTPERVQDVLEGILYNVLTGHTENEIIQKIKEFRLEFKTWNPWEKGMPKRTNSLTLYSEKDQASKDTQRHIELNQRLAGAKSPKEVARVKKEIEKLKRVTIPGHVNAALNWNKLKQMNNDHNSRTIQDGDKVIVCKLRSNIWNMTSVAYPVDEMHLPDWFLALPFDNDAMEETVLDGKLENLLGVLNWNLSRSKETEIDTLFSFH